jgi:pimeloyl-ACP methyl ester carboxylesterase
MDDPRAVLDEVGSEEEALIRAFEGGPLACLFAATYPKRTRSLIVVNTYPAGSRRPTIATSAVSFSRAESPRSPSGPADTRSTAAAPIPEAHAATPPPAPPPQPASDADRNAAATTDPPTHQGRHNGVTNDAPSSAPPHNDGPHQSPPHPPTPPTAPETAASQPQLHQHNQPPPTLREG